MAKDDNVCPLILGGKISSYDEDLDSNNNPVSSFAPISADCREDRCHWWDGSNSQCMMKTMAIAAVAYYEANTPG